MTKLTIDGEQYEVVCSLGYVHDIGGYVREVKTPDGPKMVVKQRGSSWRFWTARDRTAPLRQHRWPGSIG